VSFSQNSTAYFQETTVGAKFMGINPPFSAPAFFHSFSFPSLIFLLRIGEFSASAAEVNPMKILNIGSINIDHVYEVEHFVRPGETLSGSSYSVFAGGKGFNQSVALARAGTTAYHAGRVGAHDKGIKTASTT
jgi:hypothetical protein